MEISYHKIWIKNNHNMQKEELPPHFIEEGVSIYEVMRVIRSTPLFLEQHLKRLKNTASLTKLDLPLNNDEIRTSLQNLITANKVEMGNIKIVFNYPKTGDRADFYAYFVDPNYPDDNDYKTGVQTVLVHVERPNPNAKVDRADYRRKIDEAIERTRSYEAILVDREGNVSEGGRSNLFMVKGEIVYTAPGDKVLIGITRQMVITACQNRGYQVVEKEISLEEMLNMDAVFISGTSPKVLPVKSVDDKIINSADNKIVQDIMAGYNDIIENYINLRIK